MSPSIAEHRTTVPLPIVVEGTRRKDLGRNGSLLVVRQLRQDRVAFDDYTQPQKDHGLLAAKMMGRWRNGTPLALSPTHALPELAVANEFGCADDRGGDRCPLGAHIRRGNPRDSLGQDGPKSLTNVDMYRILRRGRVYGAPRRVHGRHLERGLMFMCFKVSLSRQFEHVQQTWVNNPRFAAVDETDPVIGNRCTGHDRFTVSYSPTADTHTGLADFVGTVGGEYLFFPGLTALRAISNLVV